MLTVKIVRGEAFLEFSHVPERSQFLIIAPDDGAGDVPVRLRPLLPLLEFVLMAMGPMVSRLDLEHLGRLRAASGGIRSVLTSQGQSACTFI